MDKAKSLGNYAFIDSQNLNMTTQKLGWKVDWKKFRQFLTDQYGVTKAYMFIGYVPEFVEMYDFLHGLGYAIVLKPTQDLTRTDAEKKLPENGEKKPIKGNIDAELVLWAMKELPKYDKAVIVSGDGDFFCLVEYLEQQGKLLKLLSPSNHYSRLFNAYDQYVDKLDNWRRDLSYHDKKRFNKQDKK